MDHLPVVADPLPALDVPFVAKKRSMAGSPYPILGIALHNQGPSVNGTGFRIALELAEGKKGRRLLRLLE
jgi:hypothetical protein